MGSDFLPFSENVDSFEFATVEFQRFPANRHARLSRGLDRNDRGFRRSFKCPVDLFLQSQELGMLLCLFFGVPGYGNVYDRSRGDSGCTEDSGEGTYAERCKSNAIQRVKTRSFNYDKEVELTHEAE